MARNIKSRLEALEAQKPSDHSWEIKIYADENDQIKTRQYKDGHEVTLGQWQREHKPKPGAAINVKVTDFSS